MTAIILSAIVCVVVVILIAGTDYDLHVKEYALYSGKLNSELRIALVCDLHCSKYGKRSEQLVNEIISRSPDIVILGGDIFDEDKPPEEGTAFLKRISALYPVYGALGNHENKIKGKSKEEITRVFSECGVKMLDGNCEIFKGVSPGVRICGLNTPGNAKDYYDESVDKMLRGEDMSLYTIAISHRPDLCECFLDSGCDLVLSGHAHGGQWIIPGVLNGFYAPHQGLFPKYAGGRYDFENGMVMIVSRGLAKDNTIVPRLFNPPELVIVTLSPENKA